MDSVICIHRFSDSVPMAILFSCPASATFIPAPQPEANVWKVRQQSLSALTPFDSDDEEQMLREAIQKSLRDSG